MRLVGNTLPYFITSTALAVVAALAAGAGCARDAGGSGGAASASARDAAAPAALTIENPADGTLFPPDLAPPTFRWKDGHSECGIWRVAFEFAAGQPEMSFETRSPEWTPTVEQWDTIQRNSRECDTGVAVTGYSQRTPPTALSRARLTIRTSQDPVGAPLFYREVNLPFSEAVKDPTKIRWRFGPVSSLAPPPIVLQNVPVCGNCHSFSANGAVLGMDVDYANDKGSYILTTVRPKMALATSDIITWSEFQRADGGLTFGLLSQVSPDGRYAISTVKDRSVFVPKPDLAFSQLFFPVRGILAFYDRTNATYHALPGADDPEYVQSNPAWSPDGKYIVFARSPAYHLRHDLGNVLLTVEECGEFLQEGKPFQFDLYRIPFNDGAGGTAEPLAGASQNGMSNYFARYSPDGKWIVFCQARNYMLLQPDSELYLIPAAGGEARRLACNTSRMNSWHSWSPNSKWLVFSSKVNTNYTQLFLTHIDAEGNSSPAVLLSRMTAPDRAANIPEFVNTTDTAIASIGAEFIDDVSYIRAGDTSLQFGHDPAGAIAQYRKALALNPNNAIAHSNLGGLLITQGAADEGVAELKESIRLDPANGSPHYNLGMFQSRQGQTDDAIVHLTEVLKTKPELADAHRVLGVLLCNKDKLSAGADHLAEAVRLDPKDSAAHYCLGKARAAQNRPDEAVEQLSLAVQLEPDYVPGLHLLSQLLFARGKAADAIQHLSRAVQIERGDPRTQSDLACMLATTPDPQLRNGARAVEHARRACELTQSQSFAALDVLGISLAAAGQFSEAIQAGEQALKLARAAGQQAAATGIAERIELYRKNRAFEPPAAPGPPARKP